MLAVWGLSSLLEAYWLMMNSCFSLRLREALLGVSVARESSCVLAREGLAESFLGGFFRTACEAALVSLGRTFLGALRG